MPPRQPAKTANTQQILRREEELQDLNKLRVEMNQMILVMSNRDKHKPLTAEYPHNDGARTSEPRAREEPFDESEFQDIEQNLQLTKAFMKQLNSEKHKGRSHAQDRPL